MLTRRRFLRNFVAIPAVLFSMEIIGSLPAYAITGKRLQGNKLRIIIETDAGGDPDDEQSLVRLLVYANEFDFEGIIANRPAARPRENLNAVRDGLGIVRALVAAYGKCYPFLKVHDREYPRPEKLLSLTVPGYDDTDEGVNLIIRAIDSSDPRPVWFCNWGTDYGSAVSCLKRALDKVLKERGPKGYARFKSRIRLSSADKFGEHTTDIDPPFPIWIDTFRPEVEGKRWYHRFSPLTSKAGGFDINRDVRNGHGPLGALYPLNTNFPQKEGDTMTFLYLLPPGLSNPLHPGWGSWGGRYGLNEDNVGKNYYWANLKDTWEGSTHRDNTLARWAAAFQNDFRVRMEWCVKSYHEANHHPIARIRGFRDREIIFIDTKPDSTVHLDAGNSSDPDGRNISFQWFIYREAGSFMNDVSLNAGNGSVMFLTVPDVEKPESLHIILSVTNNGEPPLTSYRRIILNIKP